MNIGFYGHSAACWINSADDVSFIDQIRKKYDANIVNVGVPMGSEERILFELKKSKDLDIAIIFHSLPRFIFLPKCDRDVSIGNVPERKAKYFWAEKYNKTEPVTQEEFEKHFFSWSNIKDVFKTSEEYVEAMTYLKEYFYHPDLIANRFQSAMLMIDNYLLNRKIKAYHTVFPFVYPTWMNLQSGVVDHTLSELTITPGTPNNMTIEQNIFVADTLSKWIDTVI